jgi:hypothetical protein
MHILHALFHDLTHGAQTLVGAHRRNSVALHQHVALREQFNRLRKHESYIHDKTMAKHVSRDEVHMDEKLAIHATFYHLNGNYEEIKNLHTPSMSSHSAQSDADDA